jgi:hypothetical protein
MTGPDINPAQMSHRRTPTRAITVAIVVLGAILAITLIASRRTVRLTLVNNSGMPLRQVRVDYSGGSLDLPDLAPGGYRSVEFRGAGTP